MQIHSLVNHRTFPRALRQSPIKVLTLGSWRKWKGRACLTHLCELTEDASPRALSPQCLVSPSPHPTPHGMELVLVNVLSRSAWLSWSPFLVKVEHFLPTYPGALKVSKTLELSVIRENKLNQSKAVNQSETACRFPAAFSTGQRERYNPEGLSLRPQKCLVSSRSQNMHNYEPVLQGLSQ